jgi:hypothetical protein
MIWRKFTYYCVFLFIASSVATAVADNATESGVLRDTGNLPVFDAHIHYSHDVWEAIPPKDAIRRLREAGIKRALVSSSSDEGTQRLYQADPAFVVPSLRPYRKRGTIDSWMYDESLIPYLEQRLKTYRYAAIGEFHIDGEQANTPVVREVIRLAKQYRLILHVHSDAEAIRLIYRQYPQASVLWAHAGFEDAVVVRELMDKHPELMADLSFRYEIFQNGRFLPGWEELLVSHADRFLLGIDTYEPQRWLQINNVMQWQRSLLGALPDEVARKIAYDNSVHITSRFDDQR